MEDGAVEGAGLVGQAEADKVADALEGSAPFSSSLEERAPEGFSEAKVATAVRDRDVLGDTRQAPDQGVTSTVARHPWMENVTNIMCPDANKKGHPPTRSCEGQQTKASPVSTTESFTSATENCKNRFFRKKIFLQDIAIT